MGFTNQHVTGGPYLVMGLRQKHAFPSKTSQLAERIRVRFIQTFMGFYISVQLERIGWRFVRINRVRLVMSRKESHGYGMVWVSSI